MQLAFTFKLHELLKLIFVEPMAGLRSFNPNLAEIDNDGEVWSEGPQTGHWLNEDQLQPLVTFKRER